jgi:XXXCH domain-containing protein
MLESKKRMSQSYSDLKSALEKGKGDPRTVFQTFEQSSQDFLGETKKVPREVADDFLKQVARVGAKIKAGDLSGAAEQFESLKDRKKTCHKQYKD